MPLSGDSTVLVPVDVSTDETPATDLLAFSAGVDVVLLGHYLVPEQAVPARVRADEERDARRRIDAVAEAVDREVTTLVVFTHDTDETVDRVADEHGCDAVLSPGSHDATDRVFVPLRGDDNLDRILSLVADLLETNDATATLFHATDAGGREQGERLVGDAVDQLAADGIQRRRLDGRVVETDDPVGAIVEAARSFDLLVVGETDPSLTERVLGRVPTRITDEVDRPAFVVRNM